MRKNLIELFLGLSGNRYDTVEKLGVPGGGLLCCADGAFPLLCYDRLKEL
jgi:hypothetical protein